VDAAKRAVAIAKPRLRRPRRGNVASNWFAGLFSTGDPLWDLLAFVTGGLMFLLLIALVGGIIVQKSDFFTEVAKPIVGALAGIVGFIIGKYFHAER
jgi:hypothetical protein